MSAEPALHGDVSIATRWWCWPTRARLGNPDLGYFVEKQGNFGNIMTGDGPAASRYIECRLTRWPRRLLFKPGADHRYLPSYDGPPRGAEALPAKVPVILMLGTEGIAVAWPPHPAAQLRRADPGADPLTSRRAVTAACAGFPHRRHHRLVGIQRRARQGEGARGTGGRRRQRVVISELPWGKTTESLMESIEAALAKGKVKIASITDKTGEEVRIELDLPRGVDAARGHPPSSMPSPTARSRSTPTSWSSAIASRPRSACARSWSIAPTA